MGDIDVLQTMDMDSIDFTADNRKKKLTDTSNFVDDDDLQQALAQTRALARQKGIPAEEAVVAAVERTREQLEGENQTMDSSENVLVLDQTTDFIRNLSSSVHIKKEAKIETVKIEQVKREDEAKSEKSSTNEQVKHEEMKMEQDIEEDYAGGPIEEEPLVNKGMAAALSLLKKKGELQYLSFPQRSDAFYRND